MFTIKKITQTWHSIPKKIKINVAVLVLMVLVLPVSINLSLHQVRDRSRANVVTPPTPPSSGFSDVDPNSWSWKYILPIVNLGIMPPKTPTLFDPLGLVPRSDMAQFLLKTYELVAKKQAETVPTPFTDIKELSPEIQDAITKIYGLKVTAGTSATTFSPEQPVNRAQMVTFFMNLYRAIVGDYPPETDVPFTDIYDPDLEWSVKYIKKAYNLKITAGTSATTFSPRDNVTREQMATFIYNFMRVFPISDPSPKPLPLPVESSVTKKVMVINFNPVIETQNNKKLTEVYNWGNPQALSNQYIADVKQASGNYVNYQITEWLDTDDFPVKQNGFDFTDASFLQCMKNNSCDGAMANYPKILVDFQVCEKRNSGAIDELWLWGGPWFGYWEAVMAGPNAFWTNGPTVTDTSCQKQLHIMGFNYERSVPEMLEDLGHRAEGIMKYVYGSWNLTQPTHDWDRFTQSDHYTSDNAACGNVHYAPNSDADYDWGNNRYVNSSCNDWFNYPNLTGTTESLNCTPWNCNGYDYKKWWFSHLPRVSGQTDGKWNNWWRYILDYEEAVNPVASPTPASPPKPSPSLSPSLSPKPSPLPSLPPENNSPLIITNKLGYARINRQYSRLIIGIDFDKNDSLFMSATDLPQGINLMSCREINTFWAKYSLCYLKGEPAQLGTFPVTITLQDSQGVWDQKTLPLVVRK